MYSEYVMQILRQRFYLAEDDKSADNELSQMPPLAVFNEIVSWNLGEGWTSQILAWANESGLQIK